MKFLKILATVKQRGGGGAEERIEKERMKRTEDGMKGSGKRGVGRGTDEVNKRKRGRE